MQKKQPTMQLPYPLNVLVIGSLPRLPGIAFVAASLTLAGCSSYQAGTPPRKLYSTAPGPQLTTIESELLREMLGQRIDGSTINSSRITPGRLIGRLEPGFIPSRARQELATRDDGRSVLFSKPDMQS
jgi:hypothetical protein